MELIEFNKNIELLKRAAYCYYNTGNEIMTDSEYDILYHKCLNFAKDNNIKNDFLTQQVGFVINGKNVIKHKTRMYSQKDIFNIEDAMTWVSKKRTKVFYLEPKLDGCSLNLFYNDGKLTSAATRGDGYVGQDVTHMVPYFTGIPLTIDYKETIEIRGELLMSFKDFERYKDTFRNPRNLVAGTLNLLDVTEVKNRNITFIPWGLGFNKLRMNKSEIKPFLSKLKFKPIFGTTIVSDNFNVISKTYSTFIKNRDKLDYPIDGMMIYINKHEDQVFYSYADKFPLFSIALKFPAKEVSTKLLSVEYNIGRNGNLSIVGIIEPVDLLGSTVSRATLHNMNFIASKDIKINDRVIVYKAGDIVPAIKSSYTDERDGTEKTIKISKCPYCKEKLNDNKGILNCINIDCSGILKAKLKYAVSKKCLNLESIGDEFINKAVVSGHVSGIVDFYNLSAVTILSIFNPKLHLSSDGEIDNAKKGSKYNKEIEKAERFERTIKTIKNKPFSLLLESLSINGLGKATCFRIEERGIVDIEMYLTYLNENPNANNKKVLVELENSKIINYLKNK